MYVCYHFILRLFYYICTKLQPLKYSYSKIKTDLCNIVPSLVQTLYLPLLLQRQSDVCNWNFENSILLWLRCKVDEKVFQFMQLVAFWVRKLMKRTHTHEVHLIQTFREQCEREINILIVFFSLRLLLLQFRFSSIVGWSWIEIVDF